MVDGRCYLNIDLGEEILYVLVPVATPEKILAGPTVYSECTSNWYQLQRP